MYPDMIKKLQNDKRNNQRWSAETVALCFKIFAKVGTSGYEFILGLGWPLVSLRTLRERTSGIRFLPGHQEIFINALGEKVGHDPIGCLAVMSLDEMVLR
jgi:Transposase protein